jgi:hypothetical protein
MMSDAYHVAQQELDKKDKDMATRGAGLTQELLEAAEVHAAGSSHCGEIKSKSAFSRYSTSWGVKRGSVAVIGSYEFPLGSPKTDTGNFDTTPLPPVKWGRPGGGYQNSAPRASRAGLVEGVKTLECERRQVDVLL